MSTIYFKVLCGIFKKIYKFSRSSLKKHIKVVSRGIVNILGGGSMDNSE
jgi:hypothetical protein